jgi:hypothetical protein
LIELVQCFNEPLAPNQPQSRLAPMHTVPRDQREEYGPQRRQDTA